MKLTFLFFAGLMTAFSVVATLEASQFVDGSPQNDLVACTRTKDRPPSDNKGENPSRT
ncbi:hypothetical protein [Cylindrospermopsis raciborskii]|uniref:hypothetical protein n=1 Tax=Cylindrospermopsis raciborskii TaxID=77022 RepID=UPI0015C4C0D6|nr:hypothetical protein [Cylindrospermopsis raciborskii]MCZ2201315.1 hypothetical protein [Cylindrospermopsis raciborskii PAMP2012]MCZ2206211.1 hypothetical protein [Cylindrospermopsis raciborskii PAMP2011]